MSITVSPTTLGFTVTLPSVSDADLVGYKIHAVPSAICGTDFTPDDTNLIYKGPNTTYTHSPVEATDWVVKAAAYDAFGEDSLNYSTYTIDIPTPTPVVFNTTVEDLYTTSTVGAVKSRLSVSWDGGGSNIVGFDVEVITPTSSGWLSQGRLTLPAHTIYDAELGFWEIRVRVVNTFGIIGPWASTSIYINGKHTAPAAVSGFTGVLTRGQVTLNWAPAAEVDILGYEIQRGDGWNAAGYEILTSQYAGTTFSFTPTSVGNCQFLIKAIDTSGNYSEHESTVVVPIFPPTAVSFYPPVETLYATNAAGIIKSKAVLSWEHSSEDTNISGYDIETWGPADVGWAPQGNITTPSYTIYDVTPGYWKVQVRAINDYGLRGPWLETQATLLGKTAPPADVTGLQAEIVSGQMRIFWNANSELDVSSYEIQIGTVWDGAGNLRLIQEYSGTSYLWTPNSSGVITILVKAIDTTGHFSVNATKLAFSVTAPQPVTNLTQSVIDNIVELRWEPSVMGSFPVSYYELSKGTTFATAAPIGRIYSTFNILAETASGSYKYWVVAVDTVGLRSSEAGVYTVVSQPPDYILVDNQDLVLSTCTISNGVMEGATLVLPVNTSTTFENHFINNPDTTLEPWTTPQDQINDGYSVYAQPGSTTGTLTKIVDYGALLPPANITMSVTRNTVAGNPIITPEMFISPDGVTYTSMGLGLYSAMAATSFRYVKYVLTVGSPVNDGAIIQVTGINVKIDVKQRSATTTVNVTDTASDGTQVLFSTLQIAPVDVLGITANAPYYGNSNDPVTALINFVDTPYPTSFKVLAWNKAGTRIPAAGVVVTVKYV